VKRDFVKKCLIASVFLFTALVLALPPLAEQVEAIEIGDINADGTVDIIDAILALKIIDNLEIISPINIGADVNGDGQIGLEEAIYALQISSGIRPEPLDQVPLNQFNIGDSIGEGEAANGTIGSPNHETVWSTGYDANDTVDSLNERFEKTNATHYYENDAERDPVFNRAVSGAGMADFALQASGIVAAVSSSTPPDRAGMITILLGSNDVCASNLDAMTDPNLFENQYRAGLDILAGSAETNLAFIHVSSIPAIYWLWNAKRNVLWCRLFVWPFVPCENLLDNPADDCASAPSRLDPDTVYEGDGPNCVRRKEFHAKIRDIYNPILRDVLQEYRENGTLPNAYFIDVFDVQFEDSNVNDGDCFHPSETGHALLSEREWCRAQWGTDDSTCVP
jgi:lysophospholipase L1-like esterase